MPKHSKPKLASFKLKPGRAAPRGSISPTSHTRVITTLAIMHGQKPVRCVNRYEDGSWFFGDDETLMTVENLAAICAHHLFTYDPSLKAILDLPPGHFAERLDKGLPWLRHKSPDEAA